MNVFIVGNSGAGKSTLAKQLAAQRRLEHIDLDQFAWAGVVGIRRDVADAASAIRARKGDRPTVIEGLYSDLVAALRTEDDGLIWLDVPLEECVRHCQDRPFEAHKYPTPEDQKSFLPQILETLPSYNKRADALGRAAHEALFHSHAGPKWRLESEQDADAFRLPSGE